MIDPPRPPSATSLRGVAAALCTAIAIALGGCASPWDQNFVRETWASPDPAPAPLPKDTPVELRSTPWERVQAAQEALHDEIIQTDAPPEEWPPQKKAEAKAALLRGLQVITDPSAVTIIGRSEFQSTSLIRPEARDAPELESVARHVGANTVVWSRSLLGQTEAIIDQPVTTQVTGDVTHVDSRTRRLHTTTYNESTTTWVPVRVMENQYGYAAFYLYRAPSRATAPEPEPHP